MAQFNVNTNNLKSMTPRYKNIFAKSNKAKIPRLKPLYRKRILDRFEDTFRSDLIRKYMLSGIVLSERIYNSWKENK